MCAYKLKSVNITIKYERCWQSPSSCGWCTLEQEPQGQGQNRQTSGFTQNMNTRLMRTGANVSRSRGSASMTILSPRSLHRGFKHSLVERVDEQLDDKRELLHRLCFHRTQKYRQLVSSQVRTLYLPKDHQGQSQTLMLSGVIIIQVIANATKQLQIL